MATNIEYTCQFCRQQFSFLTSIPPECPEMDLGKWKKILACNRCADYERSRRDLDHSIRRQARSMFILTATGQNNDTLRSRSKSNLADLTRKFGQLVAAHHRTEFQWTEDIVEELLQNPDKTPSIMGHYRDMINRRTELFKRP